MTAWYALLLEAPAAGRERWGFLPSFKVKAGRGRIRGGHPKVSDKNPWKMGISPTKYRLVGGDWNHWNMAFMTSISYMGFFTKPIDELIFVQDG